MVILLAEDDVGLRLFTSKLLKADGHTVLTAGDGTSALAASRNHTGAIDLLLSDITLSGMSGLELWTKVSEERPGIKVLMMVRDLWERELAAMNGLAFLQKPFTSTALRDAIAT